MSDAERNSKVLLRAEALLAVAPLKEPNWDSFAARIEGALAQAGTTDDGLLLPPLPESVEDGVEGAPLDAEKPAAPKGAPAAEAPGEAVVRKAEPEPVAATSTSEAKPVVEREAATASEGEAPSQRDGGLAELARAAIARRGAKEAVDLAKESLAIAAQGRGVAERAPEPSASERERRTVPPVRRSRAAFDTRGPWIGVAVAAIGLAAAFGVYVTSQRPTQIVQLPATAEVVRQAAPVAATSPAPEAARATTPPVTPDMLPAEKSAPAPEPVALSPEALAREGAATTKGSAAGTDTRTLAASSAGAARPEKVVLEEEHATKSGVGSTPTKPGSSAGMRPAEFNANGGVSNRPSTGAAQAAVGAVLGAARSCIAGQPQASSATIQFGSSGEVTNVGVSGPAQGTPAAACIQSALQKARVQPFAAPSFSLGVTIRPP